MNFNWMSVFTLLACLALPWLRPRAALMLIAVGSFFGSYAIAFEDGLKILPGPILAAFYCFWLGLAAMWGRRWKVLPFPGSQALRLFIVYAVLLTAIAPLLFGSRISVIRPGAIADGIREALPLQFTSSSIAQLAYLVFNVILLSAAVHASRRPGARIGWSLNLHLKIAVIFASAVAIETVLGTVGLPLDFFSWVMGDTFTELRPDRYALGDIFGLPIRRAQAVFGEPSFFSVYMTGLFGAALIQARGKSSFSNVLRLMLIAFGLLVSFSTTAVLGLIGVGVLASFVPMDTEPKSGAQARTLRNRRRKFLIILVVAAIGVITALATSESLFEYLFGKLTDISGYDDGNNSSGAERLFWDLIAGQALVDSFGLGVGAGGTRASSFILNFGASFGVPGLLLLVALVLLLMRTLYRRAPLPQDRDLRAALIMWIGWFIGLSLSVPDGLSFFYIWIELGFILALIVPQRISARILTGHQAARSDG